jgi:S1-C subfamily serine protease
VGTVLIVGATITAVEMSASYAESQELGSVDDYLQDNPDFADTHKVPLIGIEVSNGRGELKSGVRPAGIEIHKVLPDGPGATAGLQGRRAAAQVALVALTVGGLFFPPAGMLGAIVMQNSGIGQSHDLIIAVDAQRTRNVGELENALSQAEPGETVYLTIVTVGRRDQVRVNLPR